MRKREQLIKYNKLIKIILRVSKILPRGFYKQILKLTRNWDSIIAIFIRYICLKNVCKSCGENVAVFSGVYIQNPENLEIGNNVSIHPMSYVDASGGILIGDNVSIAHSTTIMSTEHIFSNLEMNIKDQGCKSIFTLIENNVWIGSGCRILAGSKIRQGSVVAAGTVVKNEIEEFLVVGGIPARIIKDRRKKWK